MLAPAIVIPQGAVASTSEAAAAVSEPCVVTQSLAITNAAPSPPSPALGSPYDVEVDPSGNIYVSDASAENAYRFDPTGSQTLSLGPVWDADGIAVDSGGNIYVATGGGSLGAAIEKYDAAGTFVTSLTGYDVQSELGQGFANARGVAIDEPNGRVYFAESGGGNSRVFQVAPDLDPSTVAVFVGNPTPAPEFNAVGGVAVAPNGNVIVGGNAEVTTGVFAGVVWVFNSSGVQQMEITSGLTIQTWGVAVDDAGRIFVADADADSVYGFEPDGTLFLTLDNSDATPDPALIRPRGVDVSPDGRHLYVADADSDAVYEFLLHCDTTIRASVTNDWVEGNNWLPGADLTVSVSDSGHAVKVFLPSVLADGSGSFRVDRSELGVDIVLGDRVQVTDGSVPYSKVLGTEGPLSIGFSGPTTATGLLPSGTSVDVHVNGTQCSSGGSVADSDDGSTDGAWTLDFSGDCPSGLGFFPNGEVNLTETAGDGDITVTETLPETRIEASPTREWIQGTSFAPDAFVDVWLNTDPLLDPPDFQPATDYAGYFYAEPGVNIVVGDVITVSDGVATRELVVDGPSSIEVTPEPAFARGELPLGDGTQIFVWGPACSSNAYVLDSDGATDGLWETDFIADCPGPDGLGEGAEGAAVLFDPDGDLTTVFTLPPLQIRASVTNDWVEGSGFVPDGSVDIWVNADPMSDPPNDSAGTDSQGQFGWGAGMDLVFGDRVEVSDAAFERVLILTGPLSIDVFEPDLLTASGGLPTGESVEVQMGGEDCGTGVSVADGDGGPADGFWSVDLSGGDCAGGLGPNPGIQILLYNGAGDATVAEPIEPPRIQASMASFSDFVQGNGWVPGVTGDVTINPGDPGEMFFEDVFEPDPNGEWRIDPGIDLLDGDVVLVEQDPDGTPATGDEIMKDTELVTLVFEALDPDTDTASGTALVPDGTQVDLGIGNETDGMDASTTVASEVWSVDFGGLGFDVTADMGGQASIGELVAPDGDATAAEPLQPPQIRVSVTGNWIEASMFAPDSPVSIWVNADPIVDPPTVIVGTDPGGNFNWGFDFALDFGDLIVVSDGVNERELVLEGPLSVDVFDPDLLTAAGTLPTGGDVEVQMGGEDCGTGVGVADDDDGGPADGFWSVDLSGGDCAGGLGNNPGVQVLLYDADGDATVAEPLQPPQIRVSVTDDWIEGSMFAPGVPVSIWVNADPIVDPPTVTLGTDPGGNFNWGFDFALDFGDEVTASDGAIERYLMLEGPLSIDADLDLMTATGELPLDAEVAVEMQGDDCGTWRNVADGDHDGHWSVDASADCPGGLGPNAWARVLLHDGDGDATMASPPQPPQIQVSVTNQWMQGWGFVPNDSVDIWINADPLIDPPVDSPGTDGSGYFNSNPPFGIGFGDVIVVSDGAIERELMLEGPLSVDAFDPDLLTAAGTLPVDADVEVQMNGEDCGTGVGVADDDDGGPADGFWSVDLSGGDCAGGLGNNPGVQVLLYDVDGDATVAEPTQPPQIQASPGYDWIQGSGFAPNGPVNVWINANPLTDPPTDTVGTDGGGHFWFNPSVDLGFGHVIVASDGVVERELVLEGPLSIEVDGPTATAMGDLPVGAGVYVEIGGDVCGAGMFVDDAGNGSVDGTWFADLSGDCPGGLGDNFGGQVFFYDVDGDATVAEPPQPPQIQASVTNHWIQGWGMAPNGSVDIWINADPLTEPPTGAVGTDGNGNFHYNTPFGIGFGDLIVTDDGAIERELLLEGPLSIVVDGPSATAMGDLPTGAGVQVEIGGNDCGAGAFVEDGDDGFVDGSWFADLSGDCPGGFGDNTGGQVYLFDGDGDATVAEPRQPASIQASVTDEWINGRGFAVNASVDVWVNQNPALDLPLYTTGTDGNGDFWSNPPLDLQFGDTIVVSDGADEKTLLLEGPLTIEFDPVALTAHGDLPLGAEIGVDLQGDLCGTSTMVADIDDGSDDSLWSVDLSGDCTGGLGPNAWAQASLTDADGDQTFVSAARPPAFVASLTQNAIGGQGFAPNDTVDIWVNLVPTDPPTETVGTDGEGQFWYNPPFDLLAGDTIIVSDGSVERGTVIVDPLSIEMDYDALTADGELPTGAEVHVRIQGNWCGTQGYVSDIDDGTDDGLWSVDLSGDCPGGLGADAWAQVYLYDNDGDATMAHAARAPQIQGSVLGDSVSGSGFTPDTQVDVWVNLNPAHDPPTSSATTSGGGEFWFDQVSLGAIDLVVGDTIVASDGVIERELVLEGPLSIDVDYGSLSAIGELPVGEAVQVQVNGNWCGTGAYVADGDDGADDGVWHADVSGDCPSGLGPDANARVMLYDVDFDATVAEARRAPQITASEMHDWINGDGFAPDATIDVWINVSTAGPPTASVVSDTEGSWWVSPPADLVFGDVVTASDGVTERELVLEGPLSMLADFATLTAVGELPTGATVRAQFQGQDCGSDQWIADGDDGSEDGLWSVDASGHCPGGLGPNAWAYVLLYDVDADATVAAAGQPPTIQASVTNGWVGGQGFLANSNVDVWINEASSGPPTTTVGTDGDGNFFVDSATTGGLTFGDVVEASDGLSHRYLMLQGPLSIGLDLGLVSVMGDLPTGQGVQVHASGPNCGTDRWVDDISDGADDGFYFVDLSTVCPDGFGGDWGSNVRFFDHDGDATVAETLPPPRISSSVTMDWIEGYNLDPNTPVEVYVNGDLVTTIGTNSGGGFYVESPGLGGIDLVLGDVVMVDDDLKPKTLSLDGPMTIDVAAAQATASGQLPTGARIFFSLFNSACGDFYNLQIDDAGDGAIDGFWEIDLSVDCPAGFGSGWDAQIDRYDADGDATIVMWVPPGDSDIDGLSNAEERNIYGTDPGDDDSDDDDLLDGAEVNTHGTDPNDDDSDNDGLLDGAEVDIHGTKPLKADTDGDGLNDGDEVNVYGTKPLKADTDGDGLNDGDEVNVYGTKPLKADTDGDGLNDGDEVNIYGTKPLKADTDGGTVNDGDEVAAGTDPLNPADDLAGPPIKSLVPARLLETRSGPDEETIDHLFEGIGARTAGSTLKLKVTDRGGVPTDADAVMLNVTAVFPDAPGFLTVYPCGNTLPLAANVNYIAGDVVPNAVLAKIGTGGQVCIYTSAATHIVADVNGYVP